MRLEGAQAYFAAAPAPTMSRAASLDRNPNLASLDAAASAAPAQRLPALRYLGYGIGMVGERLFRDAPALLLLLFMTDYLGIPPGLAGLAVFVLWIALAMTTSSGPWSVCLTASTSPLAAGTRPSSSGASATISASPPSQASGWESRIQASASSRSPGTSSS